MEHLSLWALYKGNLEGGGSFTGDIEGNVEKALEMGISLHRDPAGEPGRGLIYQGFERQMKEGSRSGASLSEEAL
jgi:hypothetical protein